MEKTILVEGMMCNHCVMHVEKSLKGVDGVTAVKVDLKAGTAHVVLSKEVKQEVLAKAIADAGYTFKGVK